MEKPNAVPLDLDALESDFRVIIRMDESAFTRLCHLEGFCKAIISTLRTTPAPQPNAGLREAIARTLYKDFCIGSYDAEPQWFKAQFFERVDRIIALLPIDPGAHEENSKKRKIPTGAIAEVEQMLIDNFEAAQGPIRGRTATAGRSRSKRLRVANALAMAEC